MMKLIMRKVRGDNMGSEYLSTEGKNAMIYARRGEFLFQYDGKVIEVDVNRLFVEDVAVRVYFSRETGNMNKIGEGSNGKRAIILTHDIVTIVEKE
jgi:hypothetical protein